MSRFPPPALGLDINQSGTIKKTMKNHKNTAGTMRNQSGTMKNPSGKAIKTPKTLHFTNHITKPHQVWVVVVQEVEITPVGDGPG